MSALLMVTAPLLFHPQLRAGAIENAYAVSINSSDGGEQCGGTAGALGALGVLFSASCSFSGTSGGSFSGEAESEVKVPGVEEAYAFFSATDGSDNVTVQATALTFDTWTNTSAVPINVSYTNVVDVPPGGGLSSTPSTSTGAGEAFGVYAACLEGTDQVFFPATPSFPSTPSCTGSFTIGADSSATFEVGIQAVVIANAEDGYGNFSATSDYLGSATLTSITVTNADNGDSMSPSVIESSNGAFLTATGYASPVPEPSSLALLVAALGFGCLWFYGAPRLFPAGGSLKGRNAGCSE